MTTSSDLAGPEIRYTQKWGPNTHWPHDGFRPRGSESCGEAAGLPNQSERIRAGFWRWIAKPDPKEAHYGRGR